MVFILECSRSLESCVIARHQAVESIVIITPLSLEILQRECSVSTKDDSHNEKFLPMATKCRMELVQTRTSTLIQKSHKATPKVHALSTVDHAPKGVTINPT